MYQIHIYYCPIFHIFSVWKTGSRIPSASTTIGPGDIILRTEQTSSDKTSKHFSHDFIWAPFNAVCIMKPTSKNILCMKPIPHVSWRQLYIEQGGYKIDGEDT